MAWFVAPATVSTSVMCCTPGSDSSRAVHDATSASPSSSRDAWRAASSRTVETVKAAVPAVAITRTAAAASNATARGTLERAAGLIGVGAGTASACGAASAGDVANPPGAVPTTAAGAAPAATAAASTVPPRGRPRAATMASVRSRRSGEGSVAMTSRSTREAARRRPNSAVHASQPARCPASAIASGVSPAISRSSPPGSTAASSSSSRACAWSITDPRRVR